ncbi:CRISPR-associated helicase/endonuclease Cas3 [Planctomycetales bacterium]|nr:CRISPR-associated helicase/endonuclease Cas3 [Planctomycetales bacterium]
MVERRYNIQMEIAGDGPTTFYAHSLADQPPEKWQTLAEHLNAVADIAAEFAMPFDAADWVRGAALSHDLGKARPQFQSMLAGERSKGKDTQHAIYGAEVAFSHDSLPLAFAIAGHHAGLHNLADLQNAVKKAKDGSTALISSLTSQIHFPSENELPETVKRKDGKTEQDFCLSLEFFTRLIFSCLVDADRLDAAYWEALKTNPAILAELSSKLDAEKLLTCVLAERDRKRRANPDSPLSQTRNRIFDDALTQAEKPRGFFSLTVPTGGGKTLAAMAFALAHAKQHGLRRVIVVIPYLSIIEQNAAEYRKILDPDNQNLVLECHSSVKPRDNADEEENSTLELLTENWDAPVVITTSVQFIESLFAASPSRARKLHNIANSVVIFDEVQTLPTHLLAPVLNVFRELVNVYGVSFVFSSATQPAFRYSVSLPDGFRPDEITEIAPVPEELFAELRRVNYHLPRVSETLDGDTLAAHLAAEPQVLCVVNLTRHARDLWEKLNTKITDKNAKPIHLSSAMCPAHRLAVIRHIRRRLKAGLPCRVISTQLIEAGVDVDFPVVWRAMGPLDSLVQVAGRCNREGKLKNAKGEWCRGEVHVFTPSDNKLPSGIYTTAAGQANITLNGFGDQAEEELATNPKIFATYFSDIFKLVDTDHTKKGENTIQEDRQRFRFRNVAEKAEVIKDSGTPVIIPIGHARHFIEELRSRKPLPNQPRFTRADLRRLQRYMVNVRQQDFDYFSDDKCKMLTPLLPNLEIFVLDTAQYNRHLGIIKPNDAPPLEDFIF